jgi:hypothetical protein
MRDGTQGEGYFLDSNDLVLDGIFPRYRSAVRSRKFRICADLLIGFFGFFDNFLRCEAIRSPNTWAISAKSSLTRASV